MTKRKILLLLLLTCTIGMMMAQTVTISPNGEPATHNEVLCTAGKVTFTFDGAKVTATSDYGAKTEFTTSVTATGFAYSETAVETVQLRTPSTAPSGSTDGVASYVATDNLDFSGVQGNSTVGTVICPYTASGCTTESITLQKQTVINAGSAFVMNGDAGWFCVPVTSSTASYTNKFRGSATTATAASSTETRYALSSDGTFRKVASTVNIPAKRAYFVPETTEAAARTETFTLDFDGTTAIEGVETDPLTGSGQALMDGKYLIDGRIVIVHNGVKYNINGIIIK